MNMPAYAGNTGLSDHSMQSNGGDAVQSITVNKIMNNTTGSSNIPKGNKRNFKSGLTMSNDK